MPDLPRQHRVLTAASPCLPSPAGQWSWAGNASAAGDWAVEPLPTSGRASSCSGAWVPAVEGTVSAVSGASGAPRRSRKRFRRAAPPAALMRELAAVRACSSRVLMPAVPGATSWAGSAPTAVLSAWSRPRAPCLTARRPAATAAVAAAASQAQRLLAWRGSRVRVMMTHLQCVLRESRRTAVRGGTVVRRPSRKVRRAGTRMRRESPECSCSSGRQPRLWGVSPGSGAALMRRYFPSP